MPLEWSIDEPRYAGIPGIDPGVEWALGPGRRYFFPPGRQQDWMPVLVLLDGISAAEFADGSGFIEDSQLPEWRRSVRVSPLYLTPIPAFEAVPQCTAMVTETLFEMLSENDALQRVVTRVTLGLPLNQSSLPDDDDGNERPGPEEPGGEPEKGTVVVGVIDDGIAFAHERFRTAIDATRVECVWLQDGDTDASTPQTGYGREIRKRIDGSRPGIDRLLRNSIRAGAVDEDEVYRHTGLVDFRHPGHKSAAWRIAHGTHVMDLASGYPMSAARNDRPIVCVQLPVATTANASGAGLDPYLLDAMRYILRRADDIAIDRNSGRLPVVINFSYGTIAGPHDGTTIREIGIDNLIAARQRTSVVLPSGNSHLSRCYSQLVFTRRRQRRSLRWRVLPDDRTPSEMEIWLPYRLPDPENPSRIELTITAPGQPESQPIDETSQSVLNLHRNGHVIAQVVYTAVPLPTARGMFRITLNPTTDHDLSAATAPSGTWIVSMRNNSLRRRSGPVNAWIQRDESLYGHPTRGRQSHFDEPCYAHFDHGGREIEDDRHPSQGDCHILRAGLINAMGTGQMTVVIGGYSRRERLLAKYSAGGPVTPTRDAPQAHRAGPDAVAVSDDSRVHRGVLAAGTRSGSVVAMRGTSVATPVIARWIATDLASGGLGDRAAIEALALIDDPPGPGRPAVERGGSGRIRLPPVRPPQRFWP